MIKAEELRIGNLVKYDEGIGEVISVSSKKFCNWNKSDDYCINIKTNDGYMESRENGLDHIPLTEELLLKCGFEKKEGTIGWDEFRLDNIRIALAPTQKGKIPCYSVAGDYIFINTLHGLQNLYHALTEKELEVKETLLSESKE